MRCFILYTILPFWAWIIQSSSLAAAATLPPEYDVVWTSPGPVRNGSSASMPLGGGDIGLTVWVENGTILSYIGKAGAFDENNSLLKLGRIRLEMEPNPFADDASTFEQRLLLEDGYIRLTGANHTSVDMWVDVFNPVIHADISSDIQLNLRATVESWRYQDHLMSTDEGGQSSWQFATDVHAITYKDHVSYVKTVSHGDSAILAVHRNSNTRVYDATYEQQKLSKFKDTQFNPLLNNTFGMMMYGPGLIPSDVTTGHYINTSYKAWSLESQSRRRVFNITVATYQKQTLSVQEWQEGLQSIISSAPTDRNPTIRWWNSFWRRSHIFINTNASASDTSFQIGRNYQLFRYMLGCNAYAEWPTKFNGGLFTFDPVFVLDTTAYTPDYRHWGGGTFTAQNQRLIYWPLLKSGDLDLMLPQFDFYKRTAPVNQLRARTFLDINHTCFTEQIDNFGLPQFYNYDANLWIYQTKRPIGWNPIQQFDSWQTWLQDTANEFAMMILDANQYFGFDVTNYMNFIENQLMWYDVFYQTAQQSRDVFPLTGAAGNESLVIYPGSGQETYKGAYNSASTVSGLRALLTRLLQVNPNYQIGNTSYYTGLLGRIPATPLRYQQGYRTIAPAEAYVRLQNTEIPQLYPVFPWHEYGIGLPNLSYAINTYLYDTETQSFHGYNDWTQDNIFLANMGLTEMAKNITTYKLRDSNVNRFPAYWGDGDWTPTMDTGATGMIGLQDMLMQTYGNGSRTIRLLPAWPVEWDVSFKLHAPFNTTVEGTVSDGKLTNLIVMPKSRMADVLIGK